jgi:hypothetical protein
MTILDQPLEPAALLEPSSDVLVTDDQVPIRETSIYATWAPRYREAGFNPLPIWPGQKVPSMTGWPKPMSDEAFATSLLCCGHHGIGLLMGSAFPDGTTLAALDVDDDRYIDVAMTLLGDPPCVRRGSKGVAIFARVRGDLGFVEYKLPGCRKHCELLTRSRVLVLPPSIHPRLGKPYVWLTPSLLDVHFADLPTIEA